MIIFKVLLLFCNQQKLHLSKQLDVMCIVIF
ncbi:hypothetical protein [Campylobacter phage CJLB-14]|nr:hypothetical protein [Campylobacter phage CJLB-14]